LQTIEIHPARERGSIPSYVIPASVVESVDKDLNLGPEGVINRQTNMGRFRDREFDIGGWVEGIWIVLTKCEVSRHVGVDSLDG